jgi:hypothetical protein
VSWDELLQVTREAVELQREEELRRARPIECPDDGTPLDENGRGECVAGTAAGNRFRALSGRRTGRLP